MKLAEAGKVAESLERIKERSPRLYYTEHRKLKKNGESVMEAKRKEVEKVYGEETFEVPSGVLEWIMGEIRRQTLFLNGITGSGKTEMMKSILRAKFGEGGVLRITGKEGLARFDAGKHKVIIMDDMEMEGSAEEKIGLVDVENGTDVRILYGTKYIGPGTGRAILTNLSMDEYFKTESMSEKQKAAIERRCKKVKIKKRVYKLEVTVTETVSEEE